MKKTTIILTALALGITLISCSDFLNTEPLDFVSPDNYLENEQQAEVLINGAYAALTGGSEPESFFPIHLATATDDAYDPQPWHYTTELANGQANANSSWPRWKWSRDYKGISRCNVFINSIFKATISPQIANRFVGEAKFLRAWFYHDLITFFGDVPLILEPGDLSNSKPSRTPKPEVITQILKDLEEAIPHLPLKYENAKDNGRITKGAAIGLKARVLLYENRWADAARAAKDVMDLNHYKLYPSYQGLFLEQNENAAASEVMFQRYYTGKIDPGETFKMLAEYPALQVTKQLADSYYMNDGFPINESPKYDPANPHMNRDPRFYASLYYPGSKYLNYKFNTPDPSVSTDSVTISVWIVGWTGYRCKKHVDGTLTDIINDGRNTYFMRYAEMLLTFAEAENEANGPSEAVYNAIDQLRDRANMIRLSESMPGLSKDKMREIIRNERRVELALEGMRWADIRRWKIGEKVMVNALGLDSSKLIEGQYPGDGKGESDKWQYVEKVIDVRQFNPSRDYLWPIPQYELDANENMVQNPGY